MYLQIYVQIFQGILRSQISRLYQSKLLLSPFIFFRLENHRHGKLSCVEVPKTQSNQWLRIMPHPINHCFDSHGRAIGASPVRIFSRFSISNFFLVLNTKSCMCSICPKICMFTCSQALRQFAVSREIFGSTSRHRFLLLEYVYRSTNLDTEIG